MPHFVYILFSAQLDKFYIGCCEDVDERLKKHLANHNGFTGKAKDWSIQLVEEFETKSAALQRENQLKGWKSKVRITELIMRRKRS